MKNYLFAAAIIAIPSSAVAAENANTLDGFVSASVGYQDNGNNFDDIAPMDGDGLEDNSDDVNLAIRGSVAVPLDQDIGLQVDLGHSQEPLNVGYYSGTIKTTSVATHLFYRGAGKFLVGAIGQVNFNQIGVYSSQIDTKQYFLGGEAQARLNNLTLTAQAAYRKDDFGSADYKLDGVATTAQAKYFIDSNWSIAVKGEYSSMNFDLADLDLEQWRLGVSTERRLASVPVSLFGKFGYGESKADVAKLHDTRMMVGIKFHFGSRTLQQRDDSGASLDPFEGNSIPFVYGPT
jgi:hypothetical protein